MKTPSTWEELPVNLRVDTQLFCVTSDLRPGEVENLKILLRVAFYEGAIFAIKQLQEVKQ